MQQNREINNVPEFERSVKDRLYLGVLVLIGIILGSVVIGVVFSCYVKTVTGEWPTWLNI